MGKGRLKAFSLFVDDVAQATYNDVLIILGVGYIYLRQVGCQHAIHALGAVLVEPCNFNMFRIAFFADRLFTVNGKRSA
ncbi:hypothetical protein [Pseudovibrio brasiliensis]|uniref:Uncharacterized protein n=1 Tax=Pseudovibrio brasiliensis TaxID=1898042 RepID=A0ABX8ASX9_9HYPH|nr:hypothetical protein [Pseudovibrio brasiliensis]QUS58249.1 hypothetical protein KGB56_23225 [Pseudovibrio brasiliensis]